MFRADNTPYSPAPIFSQGLDENIPARLQEPQLGIYELHLRQQKKLQVQQFDRDVAAGKYVQYNISYGSKEGIQKLQQISYPSSQNRANNQFQSDINKAWDLNYNPNIGMPGFDHVEAMRLASDVYENSYFPENVPKVNYLSDDNFGDRSNRYAEAAKNKKITDVIDFPAAAAQVTGQLAWGAGKTGVFALPATVGFDDFFSGKGKWYYEQMEKLSAELELINNHIFKRLKNGQHVPGVTDAKSRSAANDTMVQREQDYVEQFRNNMTKQDRQEFDRLSNETMHSEIVKKYNKYFGHKAMNVFSKNFEHNNGRKLDFSIQNDREELGRFMMNN